MLISIWLYISYFCADNLAFIKFVIPKIVYIAITIVIVFCMLKVNITVV